MDKKKEKSIFLEYWGLAINQAARTTGKRVDVRDRLREVILFILILIILALGILSKWIPDAIIQLLKGDVLSGLRLAGFVIIIILIEMTFLFFFNLLFISPVDIYKYQKENITSYDQQLQRYKDYEQDTTVESLATIEINQQDWVGIRIENGETKRIRGVLKLENIEEIPTFSNALELAQHGVQNVDEFKLSPDGHCDYDVAKYNNRGKWVIPYHGGSHFFEIQPGEYQLEIHLSGILEDSPYGSIKPKKEYWRLVCRQNGEPKLELTKITKKG